LILKYGNLVLCRRLIFARKGKVKAMNSAKDIIALVAAIVALVREVVRLVQVVTDHRDADRRS
jgi:hypothetical protein